MTNSRRIGKDTELDFCHWLTRFVGHDNKPVSARRSQQYMSTPDSPDVIHSVPNVSFEISRDLRLNIGSDALQTKLGEALAQCPLGSRAIVAWRRPRGRWRFSYATLAPGGYKVSVVVTADAEEIMKAWGYRS